MPAASAPAAALIGAHLWQASQSETDEPTETSKIATSRAPQRIRAFLKAIPVGESKSAESPTGLDAERIGCTRQAKGSWMCSLEEPKARDDYYVGGVGRLDHVGRFGGLNDVSIVTEGPLRKVVFLRQTDPTNMIVMRTRKYVAAHHEALDEWLRQHGR